MYILAESSVSKSPAESAWRKSLPLIDGHPQDLIKGFMPLVLKDLLPLLAGYKSPGVCCVQS